MNGLAKTGVKPTSERVSALEAECVECELAYSTLVERIARFKDRYVMMVGLIYAQIDETRARILEVKIQSIPEGDPARDEMRVAAYKARAGARRTAESARSHAPASSRPFSPDDELKSAYRAAVRAIHPDRAKDEDDRVVRTKLMADLNAAYRRGDRAAVSEIFEGFRRAGDDNGAFGGEQSEFQIGNLILRVSRLRSHIAELEASDWARLMSDVEGEDAKGVDGLRELARAAHDVLRNEQRVLAALLDEMESNHGAIATPLEDLPLSASDDPSKDGGENVGAAFWPEGLIHRTARGEFVRSKSEVIIANILHALDVDYRYEFPFEGPVTGGVRRPDFYFVAKDSQVVIWEHLGLLHDAGYARNWARKRDWYIDNGLVEGSTLFVSRDSEEGAIDSSEIDRLARAVRRMVHLDGDSSR